MDCCGPTEFVAASPALTNKRPVHRATLPCGLGAMTRGDDDMVAGRAAGLGHAGGSLDHAGQGGVAVEGLPMLAVEPQMPGRILGRAILLS